MHASALTPHLWVLDFDVVQAYVVTGDDGALLVDTGTAGAHGEIVDFLATLDVPLVQIVLTHAHEDHVGNAAALKEATGVPLVASAAEALVVAGEAESPPPILADWEKPILEAVSPNIPPAPPATVDVIVEEGDTVALGGTIVALPGHTPGSIGVHFDELRLVVAGDAVANVAASPIPGVFNADPAQARASFAKVAELDVDVACFGHGVPLTENAGERMRAA